MLAWAREALGARFVLAQGVMHVAQPAEAIAAARTSDSRPSNDEKFWRLGALSAIATLTGSALLALALERGALDAETAWTAAHVDEDWQLAQWGSDEAAHERRANFRAEFEAAIAVLRLGVD